MNTRRGKVPLELHEDSQLTSARSHSIINL